MRLYIFKFKYFKQYVYYPLNKNYPVLVLIARVEILELIIWIFGMSLYKEYPPIVKGR